MRIHLLAAILSILLLSFAYTGAAQTDDSGKTKQRKPLAIDISFFNHSVSVPFHKMISKPLHPGFQAGIEGRYFETTKSKLFQSLNLGMFYNNYNGTGIYLNTELAYRYKTHPGIFAEVLAGLGYLRTYHPTDIYEPDDDGNYKKAKDKGFSSPVVSFAIGLGYDIKSSSQFSFSPFVCYEHLVQTHYSPDLDALLHSALHIGIRINKERRK